MSLEKSPQDPGTRERKRRETLQRITDAGVKLFSTKGYDETTLDEIAAAAGISRRTFFHYFKSKDDILLSLQRGMGERVAAALADQPADALPLAAARDALLSVLAPMATEEMLAIDKLMRSSEAVQARKHASYKQDEETLFAALRSRYPYESLTTIRLVATLTVTLGRLALDTWLAEGATRPLTDTVRDTFAAMATVDRPRA